MKRQLFTILFLLIAFQSRAQWSPIASPNTESIVTVYKDTVSGRYYASSINRQFYFTNSLDEAWQIIPIEWRYDAQSSASFNAFIRHGDQLHAVPEYNSFNNGLTWTSGGTSIAAIAPTFLDDTLFYSESGAAYIYKKTPTNYRELVNSQLSTPGSGVLRDLIAHKGNLVVSQYRVGLHFSTDRGKTFTTSTADVNLSGFAGVGFYATDSALYFSAHNEGSLGYFLKSTDGGASWKRMGGAPGNATYGNSYLAGTDGYLFAANYTGVYRSADEGVSWTKLTSVTFPVNTIFAIQNEILLATNSGVYVSNDNGETFTQKNSGFYGGSDFTSLSKMDSNWYLTTSGGEIFKSEYLKTDWVKVNENNLFSTIRTIIPFHDNLYVFTGKGIYRKNKDSLNWVYSEPSGLNPAFGILNDNSSNVVFNDTIWCQWNIFLGKSGLYTITKETGISYYSSNLPTTKVLRFATIDTVLLAHIENNGIWRRYKNNTIWEKISTARESMDVINGTIYSMNLGENIIYISNDFGTTWNMYGTLTNLNMYSGYYNLMQAKHEFYITQNSTVIAVSLDSTKTWKMNEEALWDRLYIDKTGNSSQDVTHFLGVFEGDIYGKGSALRHVYVNKVVGTSIDDNIESKNQKRFTLLTNYPNPFNPSTTIQFNLINTQEVKLQIFDIMGRLISTVFSGSAPAGEHRFVWNSEGLASGVYLYQLTAENLTLTRKMILIK